MARRLPFLTIKASETRRETNPATGFVAQPSTALAKRGILIGELVKRLMR